MTKRGANDDGRYNRKGNDPAEIRQLLGGQHWETNTGDTNVRRTFASVAKKKLLHNSILNAVCIQGGIVTAEDWIAREGFDCYEVMVGM